MSFSSVCGTQPWFGLGPPQHHPKHAWQPLVDPVFRRHFWQSRQRGHGEVPLQLPIPADQLPPPWPPRPLQTVLHARFPKEQEGECLGQGKGHVLVTGAVVLHVF